MKFVCNDRKVEIKLGKDIYKRHAVKTHFIKPGEDYIEVIDKYVSPIYEKGDIISISEKIISLCQNRIVKKSEMKVGFWAKFLSKFASHPDIGVGVGESIKMQYAIDKVGLWKVLYASFMSMITKLFGKTGVFYEIVGQEVSGLDGFYDHIWKEYGEIGIELPENSTGVCNEIYEKLGIMAMIVDANDMGQVMLGYSDVIELSEEALLKLISDNPAGQSQETTPIILIRKKKSVKKNIIKKETIKKSNKTKKVSKKVK